MTLSIVEYKATNKGADGDGPHVVIKNAPFTVKIASNGTSGSGSSPAYDLSACTVTAELLYSCEGTRKVDFLQQAPVEYFVAPAARTSTSAVVQLRIRVLSSQYENTLFRVRFTALDAKALASVHAVSEPIRVISKAETKAHKARRANAMTASTAAVTAVPATGKRQSLHSSSVVVQ
jgi:hypothetical protein